jgi:hypothetical protein
MGLITGVLAFELLLTAVGYAILWPWLAQRSRVSFLGAALVTGNAACAATTAISAVAGVRTTPTAVCVVAVLTAAFGFAVGARLRRGEAPPEIVDRRSHRRSEDVLQLVATTVLCALCAGILIGGFRSTPWLDDSWFFWVPKGIVLDRLGLDKQLFVGNSTTFSLTSPDYPLGWSILLNTGMRFAGGIDLRVVNAELAVLTIGVLGAAARLLWSLVRPVFAVVALTLLAVMPEFERQVLGGGADLPLAYFVSLFALAGVSWFVYGRRIDLVFATVFAAGALATKNEGAPELLAVAVVVLAGGWRLRERRLAFLCAGTVAAATAVPWFVWRQVHGVQGEFNVTRALNPAVLLDQRSRIHPTVSTLLHNLFDTRSWLVVLPLLLVLTAVAALLERRPLVLAPLALVAGVTAMLVWVYWADAQDLNYRLGTSAYRSVDTVVMLSALALAGLADRIASARR